MDCHLGLDVIPFDMTADLLLKCAYYGQYCSSYSAAEKLFMKDYLHVDDDTIRKATIYVGKLVFDDMTAKANSLYEMYEKRGFLLDSNTERKDGVLYVEYDGAAINTRTKNSDGSAWREHKMAVCFSSDDIRRNSKPNGKGSSIKVIGRDYAGFIGSADEFKKYLLLCAVEHGYGRYKDTVIITDGAVWIERIADEMFDSPVMILDLYHVLEKIALYGTDMFGSDTEGYREWYSEMKELICNGKWKEVLKKLNPKATYGQCNLYNYIKNNGYRMNYPDYRKKGYFIGSGMIESGNKSVLQKRMKLAGMRWNVEPAQYVLSLRMKAESDRWDDVQRLVYSTLYPATE